MGSNDLARNKWNTVYIPRTDLDRVLLVYFSDWHSGHLLGLLNPETELYEWDKEGNDVAYNPRLTTSQEYLWDRFIHYKSEVMKLASGDNIVLLHGGDITQGKKYVDQLVSTRLANQPIIAVANFQPWLEHRNVKVLRLAVGTAAHTFGEGSAPIIVTEQLKSDYSDSGLDIKVVYHGLLDIVGMNVDYAHTGPYPGSRKWLHGNVARYYLRDIMDEHIMDAENPPNLVLRGHYHTPVIEELHIFTKSKLYKSTLVISPSFCLLSEYARQVTKSKFKVTNGLFVFEIIDGKLHEIYPFFETIDIRTKEEIKWKQTQV